MSGQFKKIEWDGKLVAGALLAVVALIAAANRADKKVTNLFRSWRW